MTPAAYLSIVVEANTRLAQRGLADVEKHLKRADRAGDRFAKQTSLHARVSSRGFSSMAVAARGATAGVGALAAGGAYLVKQFEESAKVTRQTNAVLKSTGAAANVSAKHVSDLAMALSNKTGVDDEAVQSGENLLLTFTKIRNEAGKGNKIFDQASRVLLDMSAGAHQSVKASAIQLGKALQDPVKGMTALRRVGVDFDAGAQKTIKTLVAQGKTMQAQKAIIREMNIEFGGSAASAATPFAKLRNTLGNVAETLGGKLAPFAEKAANKLNVFLQQIQSGTGAGGRFADRMRQVGRDLLPVAKAIGDVGRALAMHPHLLAAALAGFVAYKVGALRALSALRASAVAANPITAFAALTIAGLTAAQDTFSGFSRKTHEIFAVLKRDTNPQGIDRFADRLEAAGQKGGPFAADLRKAADALRHLNGPALDVQNAIARLAAGANRNLSGLRDDVRLNMKLIARSFKDDSEAARLAYSRNFGAAITQVKRMMRDGVITTREGSAEIRRLLTKDLAKFNIVGKAADRYIHNRDTLTGKPLSTSGGRQGAATGAFIGGPRGAGDIVPVWTKPGEVILNQRQQAMIGSRRINAVLRQTGAKIIGPGGKAAAGGLMGPVADALSTVRRHFPGLSVTSTTGGRHAAGSYHYRGQAVDLAGSPAVMNAAAAWIGSNLGPYLAEGIHNPNLSIKNGRSVPPSFWGASTWAGHANHIHLAVVNPIAKSLDRVRHATRKARPHKAIAKAKPKRGKSDFDAFYEAALTVAQRTTPEDFSDDLKVLKAYRKYAQRGYNRAVKHGNAQGITNFAGKLTDIDERIGTLGAPISDTTATDTPSTDDLTALVDLARQQLETLNALRDEEKRTNDRADSVMSISYQQALKAFADAISGQIVGVGYQGRALTASAGSGVRY